MINEENLLPTAGVLPAFRRSRLFRACVAAAGTVALVSGAVAPTVSSAATLPPRFDHIVVVMEENHSFSDIIGSSSAPYLNSLATQGASFTNSFAITHPSQPNYVALFSGSTQGLTSDNCPQIFTANNVGNEIRRAGLSFAGYSESMPLDGPALLVR